MAKKLYYIDERGNKKYYAGKVINDYITNETYGLLTIQETNKVEVELEYHPAKEAIDGWSSYFTYVDENGNTVRYDDIINIRKNIDNTYYFTKVNKHSIDLIYHPEIKPIDGYFTYKDENGNDVVYEGKSFYDKFTNTYYFYK